MKFFGKGTTTRFVEDQEEKKDTLVKFFSKNIYNKYVEEKILLQFVKNGFQVQCIFLWFHWL